MKKTIAIVGAGPAALMLAAELDASRYEVSIYERNQALGRKFLVAGDGGFNLTHSEALESFVDRYTPANFMESSLRVFDNRTLVDWLGRIGISTFVGTSGRVFPVVPTKPIEVLNAILTLLDAKGVKIFKQHTWKGWQGNALVFAAQEQEVLVQADLTVFALGGGSWAVTGSQGEWLTYFEEKNITTKALIPSNCAYGLDWPERLIDAIEGQALKNITLACAGIQKKGEVVLTRFGLEGGALYALSPQVRSELEQYGKATLTLDLKTALSLEEIQQRLQKNRGGKSWGLHVEQQLNLGAVAMALLRTFLNKEEFTEPSLLAQKIKAFPLMVVRFAPLDEAISTVGGIALEEVDDHFELKKMPNHYCIGEMLDWDAPTGGYLLQACFSMGYGLAKHLNGK